MNTRGHAGVRRGPSSCLARWPGLALGDELAFKEGCERSHGGEPLEHLTRAAGELVIAHADETTRVHLGHNPGERCFATVRNTRKFDEARIVGSSLRSG